MSSIRFLPAVGGCGAIYTSTVTTVVESSAGVGEGGRAGLSAVFSAMFFFIAMFFSPIARLIPTYATATAVPAFLTISIMPFAYNISYGIALGLFSYAFISVFTGKARKVKPTTWVIGILFALTFFLSR